MSAAEKSAAVSPFELRSELLLHVDEIDGQHQELLARARILDEALNAAEPQREIQAKLAALIGFTEMHFGSEEEMMRARSYEGYAAHHAAHTKLLDQIYLVRRDLLDGNIAPCRMLSHFLQAWIDEHIAGPDKQFATFLKSKSDA